jgi:uncharacterized protein (DUF58 family)
MAKRFEPSRERNVLIALDIETGRPSWETAEDPDDIEALYVVAASIAVSLEREHAAFGIIAAGYALSGRRLAEVSASDQPGQAGRVLDLLARLQTIPSAPYDHLLRDVARRVSPNSVVLVLTLRDPTSVAPSLHRVARRGARVLIVASGAGAAVNADLARRAGFAAGTAVLDGPWRTASAVLVA